MYHHFTVVKGKVPLGIFKTLFSVTNYGSLKSLLNLCLSWEKGPSKTHVFNSVVLLRGRPWRGYRDPSSFFSSGLAHEESIFLYHTLQYDVLPRSKGLTVEGYLQRMNQNTYVFLSWLAQGFRFTNGRLIDTPWPVKCDSFQLSPRLLWNQDSSPELESCLLHHPSIWPLI